MALFVCKCLNVTLECDKYEENVVNPKLELASTEQRDIFFSEELISSSINLLKCQVAQETLVGTSTIGQWTLHTCLACGQTTHATQNDKNGSSNLLIKKSFQMTPDKLSQLKKSKNYSPTFNLLVPEVANDIEMKENVDTSNLMFNNKKWPPTHQVIGTLSKQLNQTLRSQLEAVEESVRQYRDQKYAEFEAYRERAKRDHEILSSIISKAQSNSENDWKVDKSLDNGPPSPQLQPLQRRRLSSIKDSKKIQNIVKTNRRPPPEEDSLDAEDVFDIEGTDSRHNMASDHDIYDDSEEDSNDEGIHISRPRGGAAPDFARSLPMNMPKFPNQRNSHREYEDDDEEPEDIAASMKALARSVHGDAFELPRPRFSTQI